VEKSKKKLLLRDDLLDQFSLGALPEKKLRNNHLSLLAMVDCWWKLGIVPYDHMICSTPVCSIPLLPLPTGN
jgi:prephenate dehydrogenase (NADP+)